MKSLTLLSGEGCYQYGVWLIARDIDFDEAELYLRCASFAGYRKADDTLAALFTLRVTRSIMAKLGSEQNKDLAKRLRRGLMRRCPVAYYMLARAEFDGLIDIKQNRSSGFEILLGAGEPLDGDEFYGPAAAFYAHFKNSMPHWKAAAEAGDKHSQFMLGNLLIENGDYATGLLWLREAATREYDAALVRLAEISCEGLYGQPQSKGVSILYVKRAYATGGPDGEAEFAMYSVLGTGVKKDQQYGARKLHEIASDSKNSRAMYNLAVCHLNGWGVRRDVSAAKFWLTRIRDYPKASRLLCDLCCSKTTT